MYAIPEQAVADLLRQTELADGENTLIVDMPGFRYPVKIIAVVKRDCIIVVTNYPLARGKKP